VLAAIHFSLQLNSRNFNHFEQFWASCASPRPIIRRENIEYCINYIHIVFKEVIQQRSSQTSTMIHDEVIWQIINHQFCSFKSKVAKERTFCQNPYNVTGLCIRSACPLANSRYATVREEEGICYLYVKTIERAHTPKNLWEKIKLPANYMKALEIVSQQLEHFPKYLVHRNKQRLTKIHQMIIRMRKLKIKAKPKIVTINTKVEQVEKRKERKALRAAQLDRAIEKELLERLQQASEGEIYNYPESQYKKVLAKASSSYEGVESVETGDEEFEGEEEMEDGEYELEEDDDDDMPLNVEYVEDFDESDEDEMEDMEYEIPMTGKYMTA
jgi:protein MAK16